MPEGMSARMERLLHQKQQGKHKQRANLDDLEDLPIREGCTAWDRLHRETTKQFEAFALYRDMGVNRGQHAVARRLGKGRQLIDQWSRQNGWVVRVHAFDEHQDQIWREEQFSQRKEMLRRHAGIATSIQAKVIQKLQNMTQEEIDGMTMRDMVALTEASVRIERLSRGESTDNVSAKVEHSGTMEVHDFRPSPAVAGEIVEVLGDLGVLQRVLGGAVPGAATNGSGVGASEMDDLHRPDPGEER